MEKLKNKSKVTRVAKSSRNMGKTTTKKKFNIRKPDLHDKSDRERVANGLVNLHLQRALIKKSLEIDKTALNTEFGTI